MNDTPCLGISWCPQCEPERDPTQEILETRYCGAHEQRTPGDADHVVEPVAYLVGSVECGGEDNRRFCELVHRSRR